MAVDVNRFGHLLALAVFDFILNVFIGNFLFGGNTEKVSAPGELLLAITIGKKAVVPNLHKSARQDVQKKTSNELDPFERRRFPFCPISIVLEVEMDAAIVHGNEPAIGNRHTVRVSSQVLEHSLGFVAKRSFDVRHPFLVDRLVQQLLELVGLFFNGLS